MTLLQKRKPLSEKHRLILFLGKRGAILPATLRPARNTIDVNGKAVKLAPGMVVTADVKTGTRRVIEYLLTPLQQTTQESMKER